MSTIPGPSLKFISTYAALLLSIFFLCKTVLTDFDLRTRLAATTRHRPKRLKSGLVDIHPLNLMSTIPGPSNIQKKEEKHKKQNQQKQKARTKKRAIKHKKQNTKQRRKHVQAKRRKTKPKNNTKTRREKHHPPHSAARQVRDASAFQKLRARVRLDEWISDVWSEAKPRRPLDVMLTTATKQAGGRLGSIFRRDGRPLPF